MKSARRNLAAKCRTITRGLMLLGCLSTWQFVVLSPLAAQQQEAVKTAPEPAPQQPPRENWFNVSTPGVRALARPGSFPEYGPPPPGTCCPGHKSGCLLHRLLAWATYCPKYRVYSVCNWCNSCQYKGVVHRYQFFLNPSCWEGTGLRQTFCNSCYRGSKDCANCAAAGHCQGCADGAAAAQP